MEPMRELPLQGLDGRVTVLDLVETVSKLRRSEARYRALTEALSQVVWTTSPEGLVLQDSPSWRAFTGQTLAQYVGRGWLDAVHPDDHDATARVWDEAVQSRSQYKVEYRVRHVSGEYRIMQAVGVPVLDDAGTLMEYVGVCTDVTEQRAAALRTERLYQMTARLSSALTVREVSDVILDEAGAAVNAGGNGLALFDATRRQLRFVQIGAYDAELVQPYLTVPLDAQLPVCETARTARPVWIRSLEDFAARYPDPQVVEVARQSGDQSWAFLPLSVNQQLVGVLFFGFADPDRLRVHERAYLTTVAQQCATALHRAQLYDREHEASHLLQRELLPAKLPDQPGWQLHAHYRPAAVGTLAGGDLYDAFQLPDGRIALALGDVVGKGLTAAATMGQLRHTLRAVSAGNDDPAQVLTKLDQMIGVSDVGHRMASLLFGILDPSNGEFTLATAGHPAPLVGGADLRYVQLKPAPMLGTGLLTTVEPTTVHVPAGGVVVMFSDGLVDHPGGDVDERLAQLAHLVDRHRGLPVAELCQALLDDLLSGKPYDDTALLVLRRDTEPADRVLPITAARTRHRSTSGRFQEGQQPGEL